MKFQSELEMCKEVTVQISGILIPTRHRHIPEVPRQSGNDHLDMLFIKENGSIFGVEYKLADINGLIRQVQGYSHVIGIINRPLKTEKPLYDIFQFTGKDWEIEKIAEYLIGRHPFGIKHYETDLLSVYWWGYLNEVSSLEGGLKNCQRKSFFQVYKQAIKNLQDHYQWKLDLYAVYRILGFYQLSTTRKYFKEVMQEKLL